MQGVRRSQCWCSNRPAEAASPPVASVFVFLKADWVSWSINSVFSFHQQLKSLPVCLKPWINASQLVTNRSVEVLTTKNGSGWFLKRVMPSDFYIIGPKIAVSCIICNLWDIIWASNSPTPPCHGIFFSGENVEVQMENHPSPLSWWLPAACPQKSCEILSEGFGMKLQASGTIGRKKKKRHKIKRFSHSLLLAISKLM